MPQCVICLRNKLLHTIDCDHSFCHQCLQKWSQTNPFKQCPICRQKYSLPVYETRSNDYKNNKKLYLRYLQDKIKEYHLITGNKEEDIQKQLKLFDEMFSYLYSHKQIFKQHPRLKNTAKEKIQYLKNKGHTIGYYWDLKFN
tara:strand:+ start:179 stop:604 length:426 start_codon:yes stop_codon:yes gene_type:complete